MAASGASIPNSGVSHGAPPGVWTLTMYAGRARSRRLEMADARARAGNSACRRLRHNREVELGLFTRKREFRVLGDQRNSIFRECVPVVRHLEHHRPLLGCSHLSGQRTAFARVQPVF